MIPARKSVLIYGVLAGTGLGAICLRQSPDALLTQARSAPPDAVRKVSASPGKQGPASLDLIREGRRPHPLKAGARDTYKITLEADQLLRATIQQVKVDLRIDLFGPNHAPLFTVDSGNADHGPEPILLIADQPGTYQIEISTGAGQLSAGYYFIESVERKRPTLRDRRSAAALRVYYDARALNRERGVNAEKVQKALLDATKALHRSGDRNLEAEAWLDLCNLHDSKSWWKSAISSCQPASVLLNRVGERNHEARALNNLGRAEGQTLRIDEAVKHLDQARQLASAIGNTSIEVGVLTNLGLLYISRGEVWKAEPLLQSAVALCRNRGIGDKNLESKARNALGNVYLRMGQYGKAFAEYDYQLRHLEMSPLQKAKVLAQQGHVYVETGEPEKALQFYQQAFDLQTSGGDIDGLASTLVGFGYAYSKIKAFKNAVDSYQAAIKIYEERKDAAGQAIAFVDVAWALASLKRYDEARGALEHALSIARLEKNPFIESAALLAFAWMERQRGSLDTAQDLGEKALSRIEFLRSSVGGQDLRATFFSSRQEAYELVIGVSMDQYARQRNPALLMKALEVAEKAKARLLLDTFGTSSEVISTREIQKLLDPDTVLLEYSLGETESYLWLVTHNNIEGFSLPEKSHIEALLQDAYKDFAVSYLPERQLALRRNAQELSRILLGKLAGKLGQKRLVVVTSGTLQVFPLGALPDPDVPSGSGRLIDGQPLMVRHEIIYEPSSSVLAALRRNRTSRAASRGRLAALAHPVFNLDDRRFGKMISRNRDRNSRLGYLEELSGSGEEVKAISAKLPSSSVLVASGFEANRDLVMSGRLNDYDVLHISVHGYFSPPHPEDAALILSRYDRKGRERNGRLGIKDISSLELRSDLVVLSACNSAQGENIGGEGIVGMPWAFLSAGSSGVVMSLWEVEDEKGREFMGYFYDNMILQGMTFSGALRQAQIRMWNSRSRSPWYWAGFVAQGEWKIRPFSLNKTPSGVSSKGGGPSGTAMTKKPSLTPIR